MSFTDLTIKEMVMPGKILVDVESWAEAQNEAQDCQFNVKDLETNKNLKARHVSRLTLPV